MNAGQMNAGQTYLNANMQPMMQPGYGNPMGFPNQPSRPGAPLLQQDDPFIPPQPRHHSQFQNRIPAAQAPAPKQRLIQDTSSLPLREIPDDDLDNAEDVMSSRPRDSYTGLQLTRKTKAVLSHDKTIMDFVNPLIQKLGPDKAKQALDLAISIWNATLEGADAIQVLYKTAENSPNLQNIIKLMVNRKQTYYANERWHVDEYIAEHEPNGGLIFKILQ